MNVDLSLSFKRSLFTHYEQPLPEVLSRFLFLPSPSCRSVWLDSWPLSTSGGLWSQGTKPDQVILACETALQKLQRCMVWDWRQVTFMWCRCSLLILFLLYWHKMYYCVSFFLYQVGDRSALLLWFTLFVIIVVGRLVCLNFRFLCGLVCVLLIS